MTVVRLNRHCILLYLIHCIEPGDDPASLSDIDEQNVSPSKDKPEATRTRDTRKCEFLGYLIMDTVYMYMSEC